MPVLNRPVNALDALRAIGEHVRPLALAGERILPVHPLLAPLFPDGGLRRGTVVGCEGVASLSLSLALAATASHAGAWTGIVGLPSLGAAAAVELGVAMERVFRVSSPPAESAGSAEAAGQFVAVLAAVADGVDVLMTPGTGVRAGDARRLAARVSSRGGVLLVVGAPGGFTPDVVCRVTAVQWTGLEAGSGAGAGTGRLTARRATVESSGRRADRRRQVELWFPGPVGSLAPLSPVVPTVVATAVPEFAAPRPVARAG